MRSINSDYEGNDSSDISTMDIIDPRKSVWLGDDTTLDTDYGDKYESDDADSLQDAELKARYDAYADTIEAYA